jgi:hypothetical protein
VSNGAGSDDPREVGSVGEEAAKLFGALAVWARDVGDHVDTGAPECSYCPICRTVHVIREASPEVRDHLATAATSLMQAAAGIMAAASARTPGFEQADGVEHIDLDADNDDWPEDEQ